MLDKKTKHHRKTKKHGGSSEKHNISHVSDKKHKAYHTLFGTMTSNEMARELTQRWIDPEDVMISMPKVVWEELVMLSPKRGGCREIKTIIQNLAEVHS